MRPMTLSPTFFFLLNSLISLAFVLACVLFRFTLKNGFFSVFASVDHLIQMGVCDMPCVTAK